MANFTPAAFMRDFLESSDTATARANIALGNVDNTSDANKPVSTNTQAALDLKANATALAAHIADLADPHGVTAAQVGAVDLTTDQTIAGAKTHTSPAIFSNPVKLSGLTEYADDTAAGVGGLVANELYTTTGAIKIKL